MLERIKEARHREIVEQQRTEFNRLCHKIRVGHSNNNIINSGHSKKSKENGESTFTAISTTTTTSISELWGENLSSILLTNT